MASTTKLVIPGAPVSHLPASAACRACKDRGLIPVGDIPGSSRAPDIFRLFVPCAAEGCSEGAVWKREFDIEFGILKFAVLTPEEWQSQRKAR